MSNVLGWYLLSVIFCVNTMLIAVSALFGGAMQWGRVQWARFLLLGSLCGYLMYGPIGAMRDHNDFSTRHWVLMGIGIAGTAVLTWTAYVERLGQRRRKEVIEHGRESRTRQRG